MVGARTLRPAQQSIREPRAGCRGAGIATAEDFLAGGTADGRDRAIRKVIAAGRHDLVNSARELLGSVDAGAPLVIRPPGTPLWPEPHDLRFDFGASASGAEPIYALAMLAAQHRVAVRCCHRPRRHGFGLLLCPSHRGWCRAAPERSFDASQCSHANGVPSSARRAVLARMGHSRARRRCVCSVRGDQLNPAKLRLRPRVAVHPP